MLKEYHRRFSYILVDEYQDTNTAQYMWLRLLAQRPAGASAPISPLERESAGEAASRASEPARGRAPRAEPRPREGRRRQPRNGP